MLEGLVANLLNRVMGLYVRNFDPKQLSVGIWSGDVKLRNLELRKEALDQLKLPLNVIEGHLGELTVSIPWSNLRGKPVRVNIEDIFILAAPKEESKYDAVEEEKRAQALKMEKLESAELLKERNTEGLSKEEEQKQQSFTASLTNAIVDNLQVTVKNIHIRYEDSISDPGHPFAAGLTLQDFSAISTDEHWKPTFIQGSAGSSHKLAKLGALAVYWDTDTKLLGAGKATDNSTVPQIPDRKELIDKLRSMISNSDHQSLADHQFILKPVSGQAGIEMDKTGQADKVKTKARLFFDELGFVFDEDQYRDALMLVDLFHFYMRHEEYKKLRPKAPPKENPRAWLHFAGNVVLDRIHERNHKWTWDYFRERRDDRLRYISLFKKKKKDEAMVAADTEELTKLEERLSYEDMRFWRSLARNQLRKENAGVKTVPQKQGWGSWIWHGGKKIEHEEHHADDTQMSDQQRKELYSAIDWDEKKALAEAVDLPKDSVQLQVHMSLQTGSFTLKRDPHGKAIEILKLLFDDFSTNFLQRPESMLVELSLQGMRLYDGTTEGSLFPQIITIKDAPAVNSSRIKELADNETVQHAMNLDEKDDQKAESAFFSLAFEQNPLDGSADSAINVKLKGMEIVYNPAFVVEIAKFFKPPERHMESIGALMESANATVEGIRQQTRAGLEFALEEHKTVNAHLDLQAPLIIVPDSVTQESTLCLILDAGHASVDSKLVDQATIKEVQAKHREAYTEDDYKRLEGLMYDKFTLKLESTQVLIGPTIEATRAQLQSKDDSRNLHIIDRISMDFLIETCIIPKGTELTKFRISGKLPVLHASISDSKYKNLMRLLDVAVPKFDDEPITKEISNGARGPSNLKPSPESKHSDIISRQRSKSFQFSSQEHAILMDEEGEEGKNENFTHASTGVQATDNVLHQRTFEFRFVVEKLQGSLFRSDPEGNNPDQLLAELVAENFRLDFYQRAFDMVAEVSLSTLALEDHVERSAIPEFKNIISSEDTTSASAQDLLKVKFVKVNSDSPEFMTVYEGIGTNLDVSVSTINVIVTRKTLLTLLDFILITFTNPEQEAVVTKQGEEGSSSNEISVTAVSPVDTDRIRIKANLKRIALIFNDDGIRLATLSLSTATVALNLMGKTMRIAAKIGDFSLIDDVNQGASVESSLRQLVTIQGEELADFSYETFDPDSETYPGHDSSIHLRSGSIKVNFVTEPFRKIMDFAVKFGRMQEIFNAARQAAANQANQIQDRASMMQFDILIRTPIVVFPRMVVNDKPERDLLTAHLGEIYANNKFVPLDDSKKSETANQLSVGIRNIKLTSQLHYAENKVEELDLIDKVDLGFDITYLEHKAGLKRPDLEVQGSLSDANLRISPPQLKLILELSHSIPAAFTTQPDEVVILEADRRATTSKHESTKVISDVEEGGVEEQASHLGPELGSDGDKWTKLDLVFKAGTVGLEFIQARDDEPVGSLEDASLSKFALNDTQVKLRMISDDSLESELLIQSFTIKDTRKRETNKFRKIMSLINNDVTQQFMANVTISGGTDKTMLAILTIDSPRVILALDYLFAIGEFVTAGFASEAGIEIEDVSETDVASQDSQSVASAQVSKVLTSADHDKSDGAAKQPVEESAMNMSFRVNLVDAQIVVIANPAIAASEAIVLGMKQAVVAKQHAITLQVERVGMFLCRMDHFDTSRLRILDDFNIATSLDLQSQEVASSLTNIQVDIDPLVLRLSLRDILLVTQILSKVSEMSAKIGNEPKDTAPTATAKQIQGTSLKPTQAPTHRRRASTAAGRTAKSIKPSNASAAPPQAAKSIGSTIMKREELNVKLGGIRVVLIGDLHELPILDWSVKDFTVDVRDWSGAMSADTNIDTYFNVYNFSKSAWEPLAEPWSLGFHISREQTSERLSIDLFSRKSLEISITSATIALASKSFQFLSTDEDVLSKPRGSDAPFKIRNYTGFSMNIWAQTENGKDGAAAKIADGDETGWRFEDPTTTRETLAPEGASGIVGMRLEGSGFDSIDRIPVSREGEILYSLSPRKDKVTHRLLVDIKLGTDNVKYITFRSPLLVENCTQIPVELGVYSPDEGHLLKIEKIAPGESRPAPVGAAFLHALVVRPDQGFGYTWSNEKLFWRDALKRPVKTITCLGEQDQSAPPFYFQTSAIFDKSNPVTSIYPYMRIRLSAPIELQNLLPYDFKYRIYDKNTRKDWTNFLRKGGVSPVHVVNLSHLLLLSVDLQDTPFKTGEFAIVNSPNRDFSREQSLVVKDAHDMSLRLKLHYFSVPDSGGAFKVTVYSPYIVLNRTGLPLNMRSKTFLGAARAAAGIFENDDQDGSHASPFMFSFPSDERKNRALIKVGDSGWSKPQSFDALGSNYDVGLPSPNGRTEMHIGITVSQGEGKYKLTNVVTIAPRFVIKNNIGEDLDIREPGSSDVTSVKSGSLHPLRYMRQTAEQQLSLCFPGLNNQWSSPFNIGNVGQVHVKLAKDKKRQQLIRADILMEDATIFVHLNLTDNWPFHIRNESDTEFFFWQANPNNNEDEEEQGSAWRPIRYKLPPRSIMPYAWDYPASKNKDLILNTQGKERIVKLAEIGQQFPLKLGSAHPGGPQKAIDIDVTADGPRQVLVLSNYKQSQSMYKQQSSKAAQSTSTGFELKDQDTDVTFSAQIRFAGIGISLINRNMHELMYITFRDIELKYNESALYQTVNWTTKWIQVDNQLYGGIFPILLYPSVVPKTGKEMEAHPIFHTAITRVKDDSYGVLYIKYFTFLLQQMTFEVDEDFIYALLDFAKIPGASWSEEKEGKLCDAELDIPEPRQEQQGQDVYFELLHLQPMQLDLSFVRTERINAEDTMATNSPLMFIVNILTMSIGNVNDAPLRYNALILENARISPSALMANIQSHYTQESLRQVHIILGSADFLGNPVGLFNNVTSGVADIFYEPYQGLVMTDRPQDLGLGIAKGASSFVKKSVFGISDSMAKFTGSMSKGLAAATLDKEYQDQRRMSRARNRPKHALYGITSGGNAFANSLASGIGGLARHPLEGAEKEGVAGFFKGVGKGALGFVTKPAIGAFDLASNLAEGVRNTTTVFDQEGLDRVRLTRFIGQDGLVRPYSQREALGQFWLKTLDNGRYFNEEYIAHLELPGKDMLVMLTYNGIMLVRTKKLTTEWDVPLKDIQKISKERTGMNITLKEGRNGPFIPVQDETSRNWLYKQVAVAVNAYNDKWQAK